MVKVLVIAGAHSGVGKTTLSVGLMLALRQRGLVVQPFKVGSKGPRGPTWSGGAPSALQHINTSHSGQCASLRKQCHQLIL